MIPGDSRSAPAVLKVLLLFGATLRLFEYGAGRPLWLDEALLALNIGGRSFGALLAPLDYDQVAPPLFLWSSKAVTLVLGMGEYALRLVPLLSGLLLPWLVWRMTRLMAGPGVALIATGLTAVSVPLIYYSAELKPYGVDATLSAALILLALRVRAMPADPARWVHLAVGSVVALLASVPALFALAGIGAGLFADPAVRRTAGAGRRLLILGMVCGLCFAGVYGALYAPSDSPYMQRFWAGTFLDPGAPDLGDRIYRAGLVLAAPLPPVPESVQLRWVLAALVAGMLLLVRRAGLSAMLLLGVPYGAVLGASALGAYPVVDRVLLFLAPAGLTAMAVLLWRVVRLAGLEEVPAGCAGLLLVLGWAAPAVIANGRSPAIPTESREVARFVANNAGSEPVYVTPGGIPSWVYYSTDWRSPDRTRLDAIARLAAETSHFNSLVPSLVSSREPPAPRRWGRHGTELIGMRSGLSTREPAGMLQSTPDSGWARSEIDRIAAVPSPYVWIYAATWPEMEVPSLYDELARRGIPVVARFDGRHAVALRLRRSGGVGLPRASGTR